MKWGKAVVTAVALILIVTAFAMQTDPALANPETVASTELINFYSMTTTEITTFIQLLQTQAIPLFIVRLNAFSEWQSGTSQGIEKAKQVIGIANNHGIEVAVDLHTWYTTWDNYFRDSASSSSTNRAEYITYVRNVVSAFAGTNVYAFMVMNEPQARTASSSENQFILNVINAAKQVTDEPISVRFMGGYSPTTGHYSSQIDQASDFLSRNTYWDARNPTQSAYGSTEQKLLDALNSAHAQDKPLWITEFGRRESNLEDQRSYVESFVTWARSKSVDAVFCWVSQPDATGEDYNIFTGYTPHPAFYELGGDTAPPLEPTILFKDNFESGTLNLWTGTGLTSGETVAVVNNEAYRGTYSARFTKTGTSRDRENAYLYKSIGEMQEAYANAYFNIDDVTNYQILTDEGATVYLIRFSDGTQPLASAGVRREGGTVRWLLYSGGTYETASTTVSPDRWYNIELHWNAAEGIAEMFVDGAKTQQITVSISYRINARFVDIGIVAATDVQDGLTVYGDNFRLSDTYIGPEIAQIFPPWDTNQDGTVDIFDLAIVNLGYGSTPESPAWIPRADVNSDGTVDLTDLLMISSHYGEQYS